MDTRRFLENFRYLAEAPNGVARLRELILTLAMQGRLVPQDPQDEPASNLISEIAVERQRLLGRNIDPMSRTAVASYPIPSSWAWTSFGYIAIHNAGKTLDRGRNVGTPRKYITTSNLYWGQFDLNDLREMPIRDEEVERCTARKGDLLICEGGEAGRAAVWPFDWEICFQNHIHRARFFCGIDSHFLYRYLQKLDTTGELAQYRKGVGISNLSGRSLASIAVPLPPLHEQGRIVTKVNKLMAFCLTLEKQRQRLDGLGLRLSSTLGDQSTTEAELAEMPRRLRSMSISDLRETLSTLAVTGHLSSGVRAQANVPSDLVKKLKELRGTLLRTEGIRQRKKIAVEHVQHLTFAHPSRWEVAPLEDVSVIASGVTKGRNLTDRQTVTLPYLRVANVQRGWLDLKVVKVIEVLTEEQERYSLAEGDVLMTEGGDWDKLGRAAIWRCEIANCIHQNHIFRVRSADKNLLLPEWIALYVNSAPGRAYFESAAKQTTNLASINMTQLRSCPIPIPPVEEQRSIVERMRGLSRLMDKIESLRSDADHIAEAFAQAAVSSITTTSSQDPQQMKAPKTEIVTRLTAARQPEVRGPLSALLAEQEAGLPAKDLWQRSGLPIDAFYQQLKTEMSRGWIVEPQPATVREVRED